MKKWSWSLVAIVSAIIIGIVFAFWRTTDSDTQVILLTFLDPIVPFVLGAGVGGAAGGGLALGYQADKTALRTRMSALTPPFAVIVVVLILGIFVMVGEALTPEVREKLLSYPPSVIAFAVGAGTGAFVGVFGTS